MSDFNREMIEELSEISTNFYIIPGSVWNIKPELEWIKWMSYEPKKDLEIKNRLYRKKVSDLTYEDTQQLLTYKQEDRMNKLIIKYVNMGCSKDEILEVYDYLSSHSIQELMMNKLTKEELESVKEEINKLSEISFEELKDIVNKGFNEDNYQKISMVDAYVLHQAAVKLDIINERKNYQKSLILDRESVEIAIKSGINSQNSLC